MRYGDFVRLRNPSSKGQRYGVVRPSDFGRVSIHMWVGDGLGKTHSGTVKEMLKYWEVVDKLPSNWEVNELGYPVKKEEKEVSKFDFNVEDENMGKTSSVKQNSSVDGVVVPPGVVRDRLGTSAVREILNHYKNKTLTTLEIYEKYGINKHTLYTILDANGVDRKAPRNTEQDALPDWRTQPVGYKKTSWKPGTRPINTLVLDANEIDEEISIIKVINKEGKEIFINL